ncbi:hypothetical protein D3C85_1703720 [compost metagenome]
MNQFWIQADLVGDDLDGLGAGLIGDIQFGHDCVPRESVVVPRPEFGLVNKV